MDGVTYSPNDFVYIDVETGGLDPNSDSLLEVAYAVGNGPIKVLYPDLTYALESANSKALEVNKFVERFTAEDEVGKWVGVPAEYNQAGIDALNNVNGKLVGLAFLDLPRASTDERWMEFFADVEGKIPVGANVHFDVAFVQQYWSPDRIPWNHRLLSLNAWGAGVIGSPATVGFQDLIDHIDEHLAHNDLRSRVPAIDHTAAGDVEATRAVHQWLIWERITARAEGDTAVPKFLWDEVPEDS